MTRQAGTRNPKMAEFSILGMPLEVEDGDSIATCQPICGLIIVKALDEDGNVVYCAAATEGLKSVECLGMVEYTLIKLKHGLIRDMYEEDAGEEEDGDG